MADKIAVSHFGLGGARWDKRVSIVRCRRSYSGSDRRGGGKVGQQKVALQGCSENENDGYMTSCDYRETR